MCYMKLIKLPWWRTNRHPLPRPANRNNLWTSFDHYLDLAEAIWCGKKAMARRWNRLTGTTTWYYLILSISLKLTCNVLEDLSVDDLTKRRWTMVGVPGSPWRIPLAHPLGASPWLRANKVVSSLALKVAWQIHGKKKTSQDITRHYKTSQDTTRHQDTINWYQWKHIEAWQLLLDTCQ